MAGDSGNLLLSLLLAIKLIRSFVVTSRSDILIKACVVMIYWLSLTRILMRSSISLDFISFSVAFLGFIGLSDLL
jgi:hypothetical protein